MNGHISPGPLMVYNPCHCLQAEEEVGVNDMRIAFIGSGVMAEAMIAGLLREKLSPPANIIAAGPRPERGTELREKFGVRVSTDNLTALQGAQVVILSVKPQTLPALMAELQGKIPAEALVLSIVAGAKLGTLEKGLEHRGVVRAMPNTPARIGEGITVWMASKAVGEGQRRIAAAILSALGEEIAVEDENYLDMATALSGTGPSYVFLLMEAMVDAGVHLGFSRYVAEQLVLQTVQGSAAYARRAGIHLAQLRNQVTSPGGTSAEALYFLEKAGFRTALSKAIWAAYQRTVSLGEGRRTGELSQSIE
jgi:pyrroline-5-carboxylate reductase